jgi:hypothetical protein
VYVDQARDDAPGTVALALRCALRAGAALAADAAAAAAAAGHGAAPLPPLVWVVASDSWQARAALRAAAAALPAGAAGAPAAIVEAPEREQRVMHTDRSRPDHWAQPDALAAAFVSVFAEHALLSACHAVVRSNSGFSASAQAWGRVPRALVIDTATDTCVDASPPPARGAAGGGGADADAGGW